MVASGEHECMPRTEIWECRLCDPYPFDADEMDDHLIAAHGLTQEQCKKLEGRLHAAKDYSDRSENTLGWYEGEKLICLSVIVSERDPDDPMGDNFWSLP